MTKIKKAITFTTLLLLTTPMVASAQTSTAKLPTLELALNALYLLTLVVVVAVIYNFWSVITSFGGLIGKGLNLIGTGVIVLSLGVILRILSALGLNYIEMSLEYTPQIYDVFMACLQVVGLLLVVWGFKGLASIYKERGQGKKSPQNQETQKEQK